MAAVATSGTSLVPQQAFAQLPAQLRQDLLGEFEKIVRNFAEGRWEPSELNGGKFAEAAYTVCEGIASGAMPSRAQKPGDMVAACRALEKATTPPRSIRIQIPRALMVLYEIRNNRNVGHLGGDVDPNHMDAVLVLHIAKWVLAELVRVLHQMTVEEATELVDALVQREVPLVWKVGGKKRVLDPKMSASDKTLLLLHGTTTPVAEVEIRAWVEYSNSSDYRKILRQAHKDKLLEYDPDARTLVISPVGIAYVEEKLLGTKH